MIKPGKPMGDTPRLFVMLSLLSLSGGAMAETGHDHHEQAPSELAPDPRPAGMAEMSIYQLGSTWRDDRSVACPIDTLSGQPVVLAMVYTSCEYVCPMLLEDMKQIEIQLEPAARKAITFALFSFDPERDSPVALATYRIQQSLDAQNWRQFTGAPNDILELAAVLGVRYKPDGYGGFSHSNIITVLDADGIVRHQQVGLRQPTDAIVTVLKDLSESEKK